MVNSSQGNMKFFLDSFLGLEYCQHSHQSEKECGKNTPIFCLKSLFGIQYFLLKSQKNSNQIPYIFKRCTRESCLNEAYYVTTAVVHLFWMNSIFLFFRQMFVTFKCLHNCTSLTPILRSTACYAFVVKFQFLKNLIFFLENLTYFSNK